MNLFSLKCFRLAALCFAVFLVSSVRSSAATWHVDPANPTNGDGTSWDNAWNTVSNIDWTIIQPGDSVELAKGHHGTAWIAVKKDGESNAPITIRLAKDPARNGPVYMGGINISKFSWITVNGSLKDDFVVPPSVHNLWQITNNIGIHLQNSNSPGVYSAGGFGQRILWVHTYRCGSDEATGNEDGINFNAAVGESEVGYCWIEDQLYGDGINISNTKSKTFGDLSIHHCLIIRPGDDGIQGPGGIDIFNCIITGRIDGHASGHPDAIQTWGTNVRIHHNIVEDFQVKQGGYASWGYAQLSYGVVGNYFIYNNVFREQHGTPGSSGFTLTFDAWWSSDKHNDNVLVTNILIANNLFSSTNHRSIGFTFHYDADRSRGTNESYTVRGCYFYNNVVVDTYRQYKDGGVIALPSAGTRVDMTYADFPFEGNVIVGPNYHFYYMGTINKAEDLAAVSPYKFNTSLRPAFRSYTLGKPPYDFRLLPTDRVATGRGVNLQSWTNAAPMINFDLEGNERPLTGGWDAGPYVSPAAGTFVFPPGAIEIKSH